MFVCPNHHGGSLKAYTNRAVCFGGCGGMSNIDLVMAAEGLSMPQAVEWLERNCPEYYGSAKPRAPKPQSGVDVDLQREILKSLLDTLHLTSTGTAYLTQRKIDPEFASQRLGIRSIDRNAWDPVRERLRKTFGSTDLKRAGLAGLGWFAPSGKYRTAWPEPVDVLVLPYYSSSGALLTIRQRRISGDGGPKYRALRGAPVPSSLFGAHLVVPNVQDQTVHITEGELDALTLMAEYDVLALGAPGATCTRAEWFAELRGAAGICIWGDGDPAGQRFAQDVQQALRAQLGPHWVESHKLHAVQLPDGADVNDVHCRGTLTQVQARRVAS